MIKRVNCISKFCCCLLTDDVQTIHSARYRFPRLKLDTSIDKDRQKLRYIDVGLKGVAIDISKS